MLHTAHHSIDQLTYISQAKKTIHTQAVHQHLLTTPDNSILNRPLLTSTRPKTDPEIACTTPGQQIPSPTFLPLPCHPPLS